MCFPGAAQNAPAIYQYAHGRRGTSPTDGNCPATEIVIFRSEIIMYNLTDAKDKSRSSISYTTADYKPELQISLAFGKYDDNQDGITVSESNREEV